MKRKFNLVQVELDLRINNRKNTLINNDGVQWAIQKNTFGHVNNNWISLKTMRDHRKQIRTPFSAYTFFCILIQQNAIWEHEITISNYYFFL